MKHTIDLGASFVAFHRVKDEEGAIIWELRDPSPLTEDVETTTPEQNEACIPLFSLRTKKPQTLEAIINSLLKAHEELTK